MAANVLVATPHDTFGELLRISLEESGQYRVHLAKTATLALTLSEKVLFTLAILDADLSDFPIALLAHKLLARNPEMRLMVAPPNNDPNSPDVAAIKPHEFLSRPFYMPALLARIEQISGSPERAQVTAVPEDIPIPPVELPAWLKDRDRIEARLSSLLLDAEAGTILLLSHNDLLACVGDLAQLECSETGAALFCSWESAGRTDIVRFLHSPIGGLPRLLYARGLDDDILMALVFRGDIPLSRARQNAQHVASILAGDVTAVPAQSVLARPAGSPFQSSPTAVEAPPEAPSAARQPVSSGEDDPDDLLKALLSAGREEKPGVSTAFFEEETALESPSISLDVVLQSTGYTPNESTSTGWVTETEEASPTEKVVPAAAPENTHPSQPLSPTAPLPDTGLSLPWDETLPTFTAAHLHKAPTKPLSARPTLPGEATQRSSSVRPDPPFPPENLLPKPLSSYNQLVSSVQTLTYLYYTSILVPRMPDHLLKGELAHLLDETLPHLCVAFGWRLEGMMIQPDFLLWTVQISPAVTPGNLVRILRTRTSQRIFTRYPGLARENPSGDFWAPGYLIVSGSQPPAVKLLNDFINQIRRRQALPPAVQ